jgi:hypothetical protein
MLICQGIVVGDKSPSRHLHKASAPKNAVRALFLMRSRLSTDRVFHYIKGSSCGGARASDVARPARPSSFPQALRLFFLILPDRFRILLASCAHLSLPRPFFLPRSTSSLGPMHLLFRFAGRRSSLASLPLRERRPLPTSAWERATSPTCEYRRHLVWFTPTE